MASTSFPLRVSGGAPLLPTVWVTELAVVGDDVDGCASDDVRLGATDALRAWLSNGALVEAVVTLRWRLRLRGGVRPGARLVLHDDGEGIVVAAVADGVARLTAWLHSDATSAAA